jgi:hypothetical protein
MVDLIWQSRVAVSTVLVAPHPAALRIQAVCRGARELPSCLSTWIQTGVGVGVGVGRGGQTHTDGRGGWRSVARRQARAEGHDDHQRLRAAAAVRLPLPAGAPLPRPEAGDQGGPANPGFRAPTSGAATAGHHLPGRPVRAQGPSCAGDSQSARCTHARTHARTHACVRPLRPLRPVSILATTHGPPVLALSRWWLAGLGRQIAAPLPARQAFARANQLLDSDAARRAPERVTAAYDECAGHFHLGIGSILTAICLCPACSCHEILKMETPGQGDPPRVPARLPVLPRGGAGVEPREGAPVQTTS